MSTFIEAFRKKGGCSPPFSVLSTDTLKPPSGYLSNIDEDKLASMQQKCPNIHSRPKSCRCQDAPSKCPCVNNIRMFVMRNEYLSK